MEKQHLEIDDLRKQLRKVRSKALDVWQRGACVAHCIAPASGAALCFIIIIIIIIIIFTLPAQASQWAAREASQWATWCLLHTALHACAGGLRTPSLHTYPPTHTHTHILQAQERDIKLTQVSEHLLSKQAALVQQVRGLEAQLAAATGSSPTGAAAGGAAMVARRAVQGVHAAASGGSGGGLADRASTTLPSTNSAPQPGSVHVVSPIVVGEAGVYHHPDVLSPPQQPLQAVADATAAAARAAADASVSRLSGSGSSSGEVRASGLPGRGSLDAPRRSSSGGGGGGRAAMDGAAHGQGAVQRAKQELHQLIADHQQQMQESAGGTTRMLHRLQHDSSSGGGGSG